MEEIKFAFETTLVGLFALSWLFIVVYLILEFVGKEPLNEIQKFAQSETLLGKILFSLILGLAYFLGSVIFPIADDVFDEPKQYCLGWSPIKEDGKIRVETYLKMYFKKEFYELDAVKNEVKQQKKENLETDLEKHIKILSANESLYKESKKMTFPKDQINNLQKNIKNLIIDLHNIENLPNPSEYNPTFLLKGALKYSLDKYDIKQGNLIMFESFFLNYLNDKVKGIEKIKDEKKVLEALKEIKNDLNISQNLIDKVKIDNDKETNLNLDFSYLEDPVHSIYNYQKFRVYHSEAREVVERFQLQIVVLRGITLISITAAVVIFLFSLILIPLFYYFPPKQVESVSKPTKIKRIIACSVISVSLFLIAFYLGANGVNALEQETDKHVIGLYHGSLSKDNNDDKKGDNAQGK